MKVKQRKDVKIVTNSTLHGQYKGKHPKIQFSVSKRGGQLLWLDGLKYFRNNENRTNLFWRCHWYYRHTRCPVLICMNKYDINDFRQIHKHLHIKSTAKQSASKAISTIGQQQQQVEVVTNIDIVKPNEEFIDILHEVVEEDGGEEEKRDHTT